jgi:hypothetical protein
LHDPCPKNIFVGAVMPDSDQFSVNLTRICSRNAIRLYEFLIWEAFQVLVELALAKIAVFLASPQPSGTCR